MAAGLVKRTVNFSDQAAGHNTTMLFVAILGISLPTLMVRRVRVRVRVRVRLGLGLGLGFGLG